MFKGRPVIHNSVPADPAHLELRYCWIFLMGELLLGSPLLAAPGARNDAKQAAQPAASDFVGSDCKTCGNGGPSGSSLPRNIHRSMYTMGINYRF